MTHGYADRTAVYWDDFYSGCQSLAANATSYISGMDTLISLLHGSARYPTVPTEFDSLHFYTAPMPSKDPSWMANCQSYSESDYDFDASTQQLSWSLCRSPAPGAAFASLTGSRTLTDAEVAGMRAGLATLVAGADGDCTTARADKWLAMNHGEDYASFSSDVGACSASRIRTPPYVIGLDALLEAVARLAEGTN